MSEQYTPTTDDVRLEYMAVRWSKNDTVSFEARAEFDRWLAEHDRQVAEKAWEEGHCVGEENAGIGMASLLTGLTAPKAKQNPYLKAVQS